jgi:hypothetical protein
MALETASYINGLVATNPTATDTVAQADDHIRLIKAAIKATFPNVTGAITATHTILNGLDARVTTLESTPGFPSGTRMLFQQTTAPTGWTKDTTHDDKAIRVVSGIVISGGTNPLSSLSATAAGTVSSSISGSTSSHTLTTNEIPSHTHFTFAATTNNSNVPGVSSTNSPAQNNTVNAGNNGYIMTGSGTTPTLGISSPTGSGQGHSHGVGSLTVTSSFTGSSNALSVAYVDVIIAQKN